MTVNEIIGKITTELSLLMETSGIQRAIKCVTIAQLLGNLEEVYAKEKNGFIAQINKLTEEVNTNE